MSFDFDFDPFDLEKHISKINEGERVRIQAVPIEAFSDVFQTAFLEYVKDGPWKTGEGIVVSYRGKNDQGEHLFWAVAAP